MMNFFMTAETKRKLDDIFRFNRYRFLRPSD